MTSGSGAGATVTGIGLFTPVGREPGEFFDALCTGRSGLRRPDEAGRPGLDLEVAGLAPPIEATEVLSGTQAHSVDRFVTMALAATADALADAALLPGRDVDPLRVSIIISSAGGGMTTYEEQSTIRQQRGRIAVTPYLHPGTMLNMAATRIAIRFGVRGFTSAIANACAGGGQAVAEGLRLIRSGEADVVICGGSEAPFTPTTIAGFANTGALAHGWADPAAASRPFDRRRNGLVLGEGAAILILERTAHADARGAAGYADVLGWGATTDAYHPTMPHPDGRGAAECMRRALADAGIGAGDVDYLNAHATATRRGDLAEARAVASVFAGAGAMPAISSTKGVTGHLLGAAGAVEAAAAALSVAGGMLPPTYNLHEPDPAGELDHVLAPRSQRVRVAMSNSFGFGGQNVSVVIGAPGARKARGGVRRDSDV